MSSPQERYYKLGIAESLSRIHRYPIACAELGFILRGAYHKLPKDLQSSVFQDTLTAFRLLPEMHSQSAMSASKFLSQAVEATLPKQKKNMAVSELKHAKIAHRRLSKLHQEEEECVQLPHDVLLLILSFLDFHSLVSAGLVCRSWKLAAGDNILWQSLYTKIFGQCDESSKIYRLLNKTISDQRQEAAVAQDGISDGTCIDWREAFKRAYRVKSSKRLVSNRGYCRECKAIVWLDDNTCLNQHAGPILSKPIKHVLPPLVIDYLLDELSSSESDSDSDSDSDSEGAMVSRLWAYCKLPPYQKS